MQTDQWQTRMKPEKDMYILTEEALDNTDGRLEASTAFGSSMRNSK
jgi:hypothetical protein